MMNIGDTVGLVACSNNLTDYTEVNNVIMYLKLRKINVRLSSLVFKKNTSGFERAKELEDFFTDDTVSMIFDVSGGDLANEILPYLDFDLIKHNYKPFFGYSDLTPVLNAIAKNTENEVYLYQIRNITKRHKEMFINYLLNDSVSIFKFRYDFYQGEKMSGTVCGGNIRCFLKLAGTPNFPDIENKILFLESYSATLPKIRSFFAQLRQMGVFEKLSGLILGTFTQAQKDSSPKKILDLAIESIPSCLPLAKTDDIGHSPDSKALKLGSRIFLSSKSHQYQGF